MNQDRKEQIQKALISFARTQFESSKSKQIQIQPGVDVDANTNTNANEDIHMTGTKIRTASSTLVAPISPTPNSLIHLTFPHLKLSPTSRVVELGCGDGRWIISIARRFSCACLGIDIDDERLSIAREIVQKEGLLDVVELRNEDVFDYLKNNLLSESGDGYELKCRHMNLDPSGINPDPDPDLIILYLFREAMKKISCILKDKGFVGISSSVGSLNDDIANGHVVQILCIGFILPGLTPLWYDRVDGIKVYLYHATRKETYS